MALPRRNLVVRILYILLMLGMLAFLISVTMSAFEYDASQTGSTPPAATESRPGEQVENMSAFRIAGISRNFGPDADLEAGIAGLWGEFGAYDYAAATNTTDPLTVYVAYVRQSPSNMRMRVTIGYPVGDDFAASDGRLRVAQLPAARRLAMPSASALEYWTAAQSAQYTALADFDIYQLDPNYQVSSHMAYPAIKGGNN